jgi:hypothetical protein
VYTSIWWENLSEGCNLDDQGINGRIMLNGSSGSELGAWTEDDIKNRVPT